MRNVARSLVFLALLGCSHTAAANFFDQAEPSAVDVPLAIAFGDVDAEHLAPALVKFEALAKSGEKEITFVINSPGGSVFEGLEFLKRVETIKREHGVRVTCVVDYLAASMGFITLQDICDVRLATKRSIFLAHNSSGRYSGTAKETEKQLALGRTIDLALSQVGGARLTIGVEGYRAKVADGDWFFGIEEALAIHAIDGVVDVAPLTYPVED